MKQILRVLVILNVVIAIEASASSEEILTPKSKSIELQQVFTKTAFKQPVALVQSPVGDAMYVVERAGRIIDLSRGSDKPVRAFLDISNQVDASFTESGLMSMAFHPNFQDNGLVYLAFTASGDPLVSKISRFSVIRDTNTVDDASEQTILSLANISDKHNVNQIAFGPDGYLYISFGDGHEGGGDPYKNGQNPHTLMSAVLRIDVDTSQPYSTPKDNPYVDGGEGKPEIFAWGFRNPWRWSFDRKTGELWVADVGEYQWEEVNIVKKGGNYGWPIREGNHCYGSRWECIKKWFCFTDCPPSDLLDPVTEYDHDEGCAIIGGYVYRGKAIPEMDGVYLFSDACTGTIWGLFKHGDGYQRKTLYTVDEDKRSKGFLTVSFAEDNDGEIYVVYYNGTIFRIVPRAEE